MAGELSRVDQMSEALDLAERGFTDTAIAGRIGVSRNTLGAWKKACELEDAPEHLKLFATRYQAARGRAQAQLEEAVFQSALTDPKVAFRYLQRLDPEWAERRLSTAGHQRKMERLSQEESVARTGMYDANRKRALAQAEAVGQGGGNLSAALDAAMQDHDGLSH
jgi:hypothetical protein